MNNKIVVEYEDFYTQLKYENQKARSKQIEESGPVIGVRKDTIQPGSFRSLHGFAVFTKTISQVTQAILEVARIHRLRAAFGGSRGTHKVCAKTFTPIADAGFAGDQKEREKSSDGEWYYEGHLGGYYLWAANPRRTESPTSSDAASGCRTKEPHNDNDITGASC